MKAYTTPFLKKTFFLMILIVSAALISFGCGGSGQLLAIELPSDTGADGEDPGNPVIPVIPVDNPDDGGGVDIGSGGDDGGDSGSSVGAQPQIDFSFEEDTARTMQEREIVATFDVPVDDCGSSAVNNLIELTDDIGTPVACDYVWNEACTEVSLTNIPLTYASQYRVVMSSGLVFDGLTLNSDIITSFLTPANYFSSDANRYGDFPTPVIVAFPPAYDARIYDGEDIISGEMPRDPLQFTIDDVTEVFEYVPGGLTSFSCPAWNLGEGRFAFGLVDGATEAASMALFTDLDAPALIISLPSDLDDYAYTDLSVPDALGFNGNDAIDLAIIYYDTTTWGNRLAVFEDWTDATADMTPDDADWTAPVVVETLGLGDFNGDDYADVCIIYNDTLTEGQAVQCHFGSAMGLDSSVGLSFVLPSNYRPSKLEMGDINCDGYDDLLMVGYTPVVVGRDTIYTYWVEVFPGSSDLSGRLILNTDISAAFRVEDDSYLGDRWLMVGDVNGDSCDDMFMSYVLGGTDTRAFKGATSISYDSPQLLSVEDADIIIDDTINSLVTQCSPFMDINGDGYKELMYIETYEDWSLDVMAGYYEYIIMGGGADFFGPDQVTIGRGDADSRFVLGSWPLGGF